MSTTPMPTPMIALDLATEQLVNGLVIEASAGTGKTYTAVALAVKALKNKEVKKKYLCIVQMNKNLKIEDTLFVNKIEPIDDILSNQVLKIYGRTIILGDQHSIIQIPGTTTYVHTTDIILEPKLLNINFNGPLA